MHSRDKTLTCGMHVAFASLPEIVPMFTGLGIRGAPQRPAWSARRAAWRLRGETPPRRRRGRITSPSSRADDVSDTRSRSATFDSAKSEILKSHPTLIPPS